MANKERLLKVADMVEKGQHKFNGLHVAFNMKDWFDTEAKWYRHVADNEKRHKLFVESAVPYANQPEELRLKSRPDLMDPFACNSVACIAGWTCLIFDYEKAQSIGYDHQEEAMIFLDLTRYEAEELFLGKAYGYVTGPRAARVIRHFAETGVVDWNIQ